MLKMFYRALNNEKGFTLIELIVVIAILGILAAVALPRIGGFTGKAKIASDVATYGALHSAVAIGAADGTLTGDITVTVADDGELTTTLLETGAALKVDNNQKEGTLTWTIANGVISAEPGINESNGEITFD